MSHLGGCCGLESTGFKQFLLWDGVLVLKELFFPQFLLREGVVVLTELIFNSFHFVSVWWFSKTSFFVVSGLGGYGGPERTDFLQFLIWEHVVVLK